MAKEHSHEFDHLKEWSELPDEKLRNVWSEENVAILRRVIGLLTDDTMNEIINEDRFVSLVKRLREIYVDSSRRLSESILAASEYLDSGDTKKAVKTYERFLNSCHAPFYRRIAQAQLGKIQNQ